MAKYHRDILIDTRTSCTRDEAAAIVLGRRTFDPIYQDCNPHADPADVHEQFMEWLDISIFDELIDERDGLLMALDDALDGKNAEEIDACRDRIVRCDESIRRAKLILCDIDDELAKDAASTLRLDPAKTEKSSQPRITLSSLRAWVKNLNTAATDETTAPTQDAPPQRTAPEFVEPLLNAKGGMTATSTKSFLVTFGILLEDYISVTGKNFIAECGTTTVEERIATHLSKKSLQNARTTHYLQRQSVSAIEIRIKEVFKLSREALTAARPPEEKASK